MNILVAGIGNIFLGDDAFGVEVVRRLMLRPQPDGVRVVDFGIRGFDLAYALMDGPDLAILVDALPRGEAPGTLYVLEPDIEDAETLLDTHGMNPLKVLQLVHGMGGRPDAIRVVGCEPKTFGSDEEPAMELSEPVRNSVDEAVELVESLIASTRNKQPIVT